jgi:hypothetical protein
VDIRGRTVDQALAILRSHKIAVRQWHYEERRPSGTYGVTTGNRGKILGTWYVTDADPWAPGQVMLSAQPTRPANPEADAYDKHLMGGCRR